MATYLPADGSPCFLAPANGRTFTLAELHKLVGGYFEVVATDMGIYENGTTYPLLLLVNEEGKLRELPRNKFASALSARVADEIVGDAVLCTAQEMGEPDHAENT